MRAETMKAYALLLATGWASSAFAAAAPAPTATAVASISVTNPLPAERKAETIAVARAELVGLAPSADLEGLVVTDAAGRPVLSQLVDLDGDEKPDELVFQTDLAGRQNKIFRLRAGTRTSPAVGDFKVYGRFVRERYDDFAWENDLVAHRVYGPALETAVKEPLVSSGIDTWVKRVPRLIVNSWYLTGDYHRDLGEGADFYGVGKSRGCGGVGIWAGGVLNVSRNFVSSRVLAEGPIRLVFELRYAPFDAGPGVRVAETKRITLDAGTPWNRIESTFAGNGATKIWAGVGIAKHPGGVPAVDPGSSSLRVWEPLKGQKGDDNGSLGCAVVLAPGAPIEEHGETLDYLVVTPVGPGGKLDYRMGTSWDRGGRIRDAAGWGREVQAQAARLAAPVKVVLGPPK